MSTVPTRWITGSSSSAPGALVRILEDAGWDEAVVKPVVSASAYNTWRVSRDDAAARAAEHDARIRELVGREGVMVQPYLPEFERDGEWSLIFFDGILSHAVVKRAAPGEFRVQRKYGARFETAVPPREIALQAHAAVGASPERPLYARVDGVVVGTTLVVTELELLEPSLFLDADPAAPERFANAIVGALVRRQPE